MSDSQSLPELSKHREQVNALPYTSPYQARQLIKRRSKSSNTKIGQKHRLNSRECSGIQSGLSGRCTGSSSSRTLVCTPSYTLSRTASATEMKIMSNKFFCLNTFEAAKPVAGSNSTSVKKKVAGGNVWNAFTQESLEREERLQREIVDANIQLNNMTMDYKQSIEKLGETHEKAKIKIKKDFENTLKQQEENFTEKIRQLEEKHKIQMQVQKSHMEYEIEELHAEIEYQTKLMDESREEMNKATEERLKTLKNAMSRAHQEELKNVRDLAAQNCEDMVSEYKEELKNTYEKTISGLKYKHMKEIEELKDKTMSVHKLKEKIKKLTEETQNLTENVVSLTDQLTLVNAEKCDVEVKLLNTQYELQEFQKNFDAKIKQVMSSNAAVSDALRQENSKLRGRIIEQTHTLAQHQALLDMRNGLGRTKMKLRVRQMLQARLRANLSLIGDISSNKLKMPSMTPRSRPLSAPTTSSEVKLVHLHARAKELPQ